MARTFAITLLLFCCCLPRLAAADEPAPAAPAADVPAALSSGAIVPATMPQVQQAVDRAITYLQTESAAWLNTRKCAACHHLPLPLWALGEAERQGYAIDKKFLGETTESLLGSPEKLLSSRIFPNPADPPDTRPQGNGLNMGLPMLVVAARSYSSLTDAQQQTMQLITDEMIKKQQPDGSWEFFAGLRRPPINESQTSDAAWIILALHGETGQTASEQQRLALAKAVAWFERAAQAGDPQDKAFALLVGTRTGRPRSQMQATIDELLALQRPDAGWGQLADLPSDAYATGQALYVLSLLGYTTERPEIRRAIDFLITNQQADGSWPMTSRATPNGEPGSAKLLTPITCAASSWATLGLARLVPKAP
jgi:Prenyltransferase and squalene oxidase repeat